MRVRELCVQTVCLILDEAWIDLGFLIEWEGDFSTGERRLETMWLFLFTTVEGKGFSGSIYELYSST